MSRKMPDYRLQLARNLRQRQTLSEQILWNQLRGGRFAGYKFRRQQPLGRYIADFCCHAVKIVIEIDGGVHENLDAQEYDAIRDTMIAAYGYRVLRVAAHDVENQPETVLEQILQALPPASEPEEP